jgi:pimeloyl-ACP methyl ester carboxylesterase
MLLPTQTLSVDGVTVHYTDQGSGPAVLLIHGFPETLQGWRRNVPELSKHFRTVALDMVGSGRTDKADWDYSCAGLARFVKKFTEQLGLSKFHLVGTDTGASIALAFAADYPESVNKMVIFSGTAYSNSVKAPEVRLMMVPGLGHAIFLLFGGIGTRLGVYRGFHQWKNIDPEAVREYVECLASVKARMLAVRLMIELEKTAGLALPKLKQKCPPSLILWAEHEVFFYSWVPQKLNQDLQGSKLEIISGSGHFIQEEKSALWNEKVIRFLQ